MKRRRTSLFGRVAMLAAGTTLVVSVAAYVAGAVGPTDNLEWNRQK